MPFSPLLYIHGSDSSGQTYKAQVIRRAFPHLLSPDFTGTLSERMAQLGALLESTEGWTLIGSSLGGLMAALYAAKHPQRLRKLILLAPALTLPEFAAIPPASIHVPTVIVHGRQDDVVPITATRQIAGQVFTSLTFLEVEDDHRLHRTAEALDWTSLLQQSKRRRGR
ncbi:MAG: alpha/beta hydrolase [Anaerolineales bacterium]